MSSIVRRTSPSSVCALNTIETRSPSMQCGRRRAPGRGELRDGHRRLERADAFWRTFWRMGAVNVSVPPEEEEEEEEEEAGERGEAASGSDPGVSEAEAPPTRGAARGAGGRSQDARARARGRRGRRRRRAHMARWAIAKAAADRPSGRIDARGRGRRARERARVSGGEARSASRGDGRARERARGASVKRADERTRRGGGAGGDTPAARRRGEPTTREIPRARSSGHHSRRFAMDRESRGLFARPPRCVSRSGRARPHLLLDQRPGPARGTPAVPRPGAMSEVLSPVVASLRGVESAGGTIATEPPRDVPTHPPRVRPPRPSRSRPRDRTSEVTSSDSRARGRPPRRWDIARSEMAAGTHAARGSGTTAGSSASWCAALPRAREDGPPERLPLAPHPTTPFPTSAPRLPPASRPGVHDGASRRPGGRAEATLRARRRERRVRAHAQTLPRVDLLDASAATRSASPREGRVRRRLRRGRGGDVPRHARGRRGVRQLVAKIHAFLEEKRAARSGEGADGDTYWAGRASRSG